MNWHHWLMLLLMFIIAISFDRFFPQLGNAVPFLPHR